MRLPCIRFTMGALLVLVAVAGLNCWAVPHFNMTPVHIMGPAWHRVMPLGIGVLPLVNVVVIGALVLAIRRGRSVRRGVATAEGPSLLAGATFFGLNIVLLGSLVVSLPELNHPGFSWPIVDAVRDRAVRCWAAVAGPPGDSIAWIVFDCALLGVVVSGPPLLVSWLGGLLARRYAATVPRGRFLATAGLVELGFVAAGLSILLTPSPFAGALEVPLEVRVVDEETGKPVRGAFVAVANDFDLVSDLIAYGVFDIEDAEGAPPRAFTDADGRARLTEKLVGVGERNAFQTHAAVSPWGRWLAISAEGYRTRRIALPEVLGADVDPDRPVAGAVKLARGEEDVGPFRDSEGVYYEDGGGFGGALFVITRDGRFAWRAWGCVPPDEREYGYARHRGDEIELVPIPHPGSDMDSMTTSRFRTVAWGRRLYLSDASDDALQAFCRMALIPDRPPPEDDAGGYFLLRYSDSDVPREGLPRVPLRIWAKFLAGELNPGNKQGSLRLALDSLTAKVGRKG